MSELNPIFHDVERRAVAATDGTATRLLSLNKFDAQQLLDVCQKYMLQQHSQGYSEVNTQLSEADRVELGVDKDD
mgnify:CR=1 FL=1